MAGFAFARVEGSEDPLSFPPAFFVPDVFLVFVFLTILVLAAGFALEVFFAAVLLAGFVRSKTEHPGRA